MRDWSHLAFVKSRPYTEMMQTDAYTRTSQAASLDSERKAKIAHMQALVDEALASGISSKTMQDIWCEARAQARERGF